jgi:hypothetical protein
MKKLRALGVFAVAAASLTAFAGSASATTPVIFSTGVEYTGTIDFSGTESLFWEASVIQITCTEWTIEGDVTTNTNGVASGPITSISLTNCGESTVDTLAAGSFEIKSGGETRLSGNRVTMERFGISCVYGGGTGTKFGTLKAGGSLKVEAALPKQTGSNFLCPSTAAVSGTGTITSPHNITFD